MKNRVLSMFLSVCMMLSNCSNSYVAIAFENNNTNDGTETTVGEIADDNSQLADNSNEENIVDDPDVVTPDDGSDNTGESDGDSSENNPGSDNSENNPDGDTSEAEKIVIEVRETQHPTLYNGQDVAYILNYIENGNPRCSQYYSSWKMDNIQWVKMDIFSELEVRYNEEDKTISFNLIDENSQYTLQENEFSISLRNDYNPTNVNAEKSYQNGEYLLKCSDASYFISLDGQSFDAAVVLPDSSSVEYYLRNMDEASHEYGAISQVMTFDNNPEIVISDKAAVSGIDFSTTKAHNKPITITVTGEVKANTCQVSISNNDKVVSQTEPELRWENGKNIFAVDYTFTIPENDMCKIGNLNVSVSVNGRTENRNVQLVGENNSVLNGEFILEANKPVLPPELSGYPVEINGKKIDRLLFDVTDNETDIKTIEYRYEDDDEWLTIDKREKIDKGYSVTFELPSANRRVVFFRTVDLAGNEVISSRTPAPNYIWTKDVSEKNNIIDLLPTIDSIKLFYSDVENPAEDTDWIEIIDNTRFHTYSWGNAINAKMLRIAVVTETKPNYKIADRTLIPKTVIITEDTDDDGVADVEEKHIEYYYVDLEPGAYEGVSLSLEGAGSTELRGLVDKFDERIENPPSSNNIYIESTKPEAKLTHPQFASENAATNGKWYGINQKDGEFEIVITENDSDSGISAIQIESVDKANFVINKTDLGEIVADNDYYFPISNRMDKPIEVIIKIPVSTFEDGDHELKIKITDGAGNVENGFVFINGDANYNEETQTNKPFEFRTDFTPPSGEINLISESKTIDGQEWFDDADNVEFEFVIDDANPNKVTWTMNQDPNAQKYHKNFVDGESTISALLRDTNATIDENHSYTIRAVFYDQAGNASEDGLIDAKTFYKDMKNPSIGKITVSREPETAGEKVLRVLSFGIFSNDDVKITVEASDAEHDSGLNDDALEISLDGGTTYSNMKPEAGKYVSYIRVSDVPATGKIAVRVTDQFGHYYDTALETTEITKIVAGDNAEGSGTDSKDFILERILPDLKVELPDSDGVVRTDGNIWYNTDKDITITVQDSDSGIRFIEVHVNDVKIERDAQNVNFITESTVKDNEEHIYHLSTDKLSEILRESGKHPEDGRYVVKVCVVDNAGNKKEDEKVYYIDKTVPVIGKIDFSMPSADGNMEGDVSQHIEQLEYGYYFKTDLVATVNVFDERPSSGLHRIEYVLVDYNNGVKGEEHPGKAEINEGKAIIPIHKEFKGQILVKAYDYVENESEEGAPELFVVDTPERHDSEKHIIIDGFGTTEYSLGQDHPLYDRTVDLTVTISDTISGIRDISYSMNSELNTYETRVITISNEGHEVNQQLGDGWVITKMDENLVTEVQRNYVFAEDNNDIQLFFAMTDRANNTSEEPSTVFSIDQTAPVINVVFAETPGIPEFYSEDRVATITVIERNFDPAKIITSITNQIGELPKMETVSDTNTEHVMRITFGEGDYTFSIEGSDYCEHPAIVNYSGGNERSFYVDKTDPILEGNFEEFVNSLENTFNTGKVMTLTIKEHNFDPELVNIEVYYQKAGEVLTETNREECTSEFVTPNMWQSLGDTHTAHFNFTKDYVYQVTVSAMDSSGRTLELKTSPVFEIDMTAPVLKTPSNFEKLVYTSKDTKTEAQPIVYDDANIARVDYTVVSYQLKHDEDNVGYAMKVDSGNYVADKDSVVIDNDYFSQDGIYEVKCIAYDVAGNSSDESTHTFVIQRDSDFLVYIPNSSKENQTGYYKFNQKGIRSTDFEDIEIVAYITNDKTLEIHVDGTEVEASDLEIQKDGNKINQVDVYNVTLKKSYVLQNYDAETVDADLTLNAVVSNENADQTITLGHIYIDNVKPVGEYEAAIQDLGFFDGFYGMESRKVIIEGVSPDIDIEKCEIQVNDTTLKDENNGFIYDENANTISFIIDEGYSDIRPTLVDKAGNINNLEMAKNVYVGSLFARWWYLIIFGGLIILSTPTIMIMTLVRKKKSKNTN